MCVIGLLMVGGWQIGHLTFGGGDPILLRLRAAAPARRSHARPLDGAPGSQAVLPLGDLIRDLVYDPTERARLLRLTLDVPGTVLRTGSQVEPRATPTASGGD